MLLYNHNINERMHNLWAERTTSFLKLMSKKLAVMIILIVFIVILITTVFLMNKANRDEYTLIDVFGRQRMLTQQLTKYANQNMP